MAFSKCRSRFIERAEMEDGTDGEQSPSDSRLTATARVLPAGKNRRCIHIHCVCRVVPSPGKTPVAMAGRQNHRPSFRFGLAQDRGMPFFAVVGQEMRIL